MDVEKARKYFDARDARERARGRAGGVWLIAGYYAGALAVLAGAAVLALIKVVSGG